MIAARDPFEQVAGRGAARLADAGIVVEQGLLAAQARELNIGFFSRIERGRPWTRATLGLPIDAPPALDSAELAALDAALSEARDDLRHWRARSSLVLERAPDAGRAVGCNAAAPRYVVSARDCAALGAASAACAPADGVPTLALHRDDNSASACEDAHGIGHRARRVDRVDHVDHADARPAGAPSASASDTDAGLPLPDAFARLARWTNLVDLYRALGGGWLERAGETPRPADAPVDYGKAAPAPAASASARTAAVIG
ncbi:putative outer membrane efflux protein OprM [Burkholderia pseudomallei]|nr:putative outer membrane efflux protein OprM [Burkholderia pseudomallei]